MSAHDEESSLLRGNAAPKYRTSLIVGALAVASFMFGVGAATVLDRNAARATRLEVDVAAQAGVAVDYIPKVTDKASDYANDPSSIPVEDVVDTVQPVIEKVFDNFDEEDLPGWVNPIIKTVNGIVGWINGLLGGGGGGGNDDMDDDETNAKVLCPGQDSGFEQEYCDCMGDCTDPERSAWCACAEAQACCATSGDDMSGMSADDGTPAAPGDMAGDDGTPAAPGDMSAGDAKVLCPDHPLGEDPSSSEYCDCEGDCTDPERSAWCACSEAQLCCASGTSADDGTPAAPGDMSAGDDGTPADSGDMSAGDEGTPAASGDDTSGDSGTPADSGDMSAGDDGTPVAPTDDQDDPSDP